MSIKSNIVHLYFKKEVEGSKIYVKVNPIHLTGSELVVHSNGELETRHMEFDEAIFEDLKMDDFEEVNGLEYNLLLSGFKN